MIYGTRAYTEPISVAEINTFIKNIFDSEPLLSDVYVRGEISNFKAHSTGHMYFSLKDSDSVLKCVMFKSSAVNLPFLPENGMKVVAHGRVSTFVRDGQYQLYCDNLEMDGIGSLYVAFEQLKEKLKREGLFDSAKKKPLPKIPKRVGIVTSPTGAAIRDMINVMGRRFPYAEIVLYPALVQGDSAPASLCSGINYFNREGKVDVIIIGRGGGSIEDLWAFNNEMLAYEIFNSDIPVISAVGHETDFTISDFVADLRAPTPSAAAELAVPDLNELKRKFNNIITRETSVLKKEIEHLRAKLDRYATCRVLTSPYNMIEDKRMTILSVSNKLDRASRLIIKDKRNLFTSTVARLEALNPMSVISRGYSAVFDVNDRVVKSVNDIERGSVVTLRMSDGSATAEVIKTEKAGNENGK